MQPIETPINAVQKHNILNSDSPTIAFNERVSRVVTHEKNHCLSVAKYFIQNKLEAHLEIDHEELTSLKKDYLETPSKAEDLIRFVVSEKIAEVASFVIETLKQDISDHIKQKYGLAGNILDVIVDKLSTLLELTIGDLVQEVTEESFLKQLKEKLESTN